MTTLNTFQIELLQAAANADGVDAPANRRNYAQLIKDGLLISLPRGDGPSRLLITDAGRAAISPQAAGSAENIPEPPGACSLAPAPKGKIGALVTLLRGPEGTTIEAMMEATGWQAHSVRGAISGSVKKVLGLTVSSVKTGAGRIYRIVEDVAA